MTPIERLRELIAREGTASLTEEELGLLSIYWFVLETNNGGLDQFFFNESGQYAASAHAYLRQIGAAETANILQRAIKLFPDHKVPSKLRDRRELMVDHDSVFEPLNRLTDELFKSREDVNDFHLKFVERNPELFSRISPPRLKQD